VGGGCGGEGGMVVSGLDGMNRDVRNACGTGGGGEGG